MSDCPCCGYPGVPPTDAAFWCRYMAMTEPQKGALREAANALMKLDQQSSGNSSEGDT